MKGAELLAFINNPLLSTAEMVESAIISLYSKIKKRLTPVESRNPQSKNLKGRLLKRRNIISILNNKLNRTGYGKK